MTLPKTRQTLHFATKLFEHVSSWSADSECCWSSVPWFPTCIPVIMSFPDLPVGYRVYCAAADCGPWSRLLIDSLIREGPSLPTDAREWLNLLLGFLYPELGFGTRTQTLKCHWSDVWHIWIQDAFHYSSKRHWKLDWDITFNQIASFLGVPCWRRIISTNVCRAVVNEYFEM